VNAPVGLIAGLGRFPVELARAARRRGHRVVAVALGGLADADVAAAVDECSEVPLGQLGRLFHVLREAGVKQVVLAGKVPKTFLYRHADRVQPDATALRLLASLRDRRDDSILGAFAGALDREGFELIGQADLAPELWAGEGRLGAVEADARVRADVAFGWPVAKWLGELDVGQTVVVEGRAVLALEAIEGTDEAIRRGCALGSGRAVAVKVSKPRQDPRFDVPAVGAATVRALAEAGGAALAVEAARTVLLQREELVAAADAAGIAVVGVDGARLPAAREEA
jgi:DUF1009 family protein